MIMMYTVYSIDLSLMNMYKSIFAIDQKLTICVCARKLFPCKFIPGSLPLKSKRLVQILISKIII